MAPTEHQNSPSFLLSDYFFSDCVIRDGPFSHLDEADAVRSGALVYCQNAHYLGLAAKNKNVGALITTPSLATKGVDGVAAIVAAEDPRMAFFQLYTQFHDRGLNDPVMQFGIREGCHIHPTAVVSPKAKIGAGVEIGANAVIADFVDIGDNVFIGPNTVIGAEGLVTLRTKDGQLLMIKHSGGVEIGEGSLVLAGAVVAKSLFPSFTRIGKRCQVGIMANIGHGASLGDDVVVSGNTVVAGRTKIGPKAWIGTSASIAQGLSIGAGAQIKMGSVVVGDIAPGDVVSGNFAVPHHANIRHFFAKKAL